MKKDSAVGVATWLGAGRGAERREWGTSQVVPEDSEGPPGREALVFTGVGASWSPRRTELSVSRVQRGARVPRSGKEGPAAGGGW